MSRIGKKLITIPENTEVEIEGRDIRIKGPKGQLERKMRSEIGIEKKENELHLFIKKETKRSNAFFGLERSLVFNMIKGVNDGFEKLLELQGVGYRARMEGDELVIDAGFSHPIKMKKPEDVSLEVEKGKIKVSGIDKCRVGQVAAKVRAVRPPEPYKGKGIKYEDEQIIRKEGKKAVGSD